MKSISLTIRLRICRQRLMCEYHTTICIVLLSLPVAQKLVTSALIMCVCPSRNSLIGLEKDLSDIASKHKKNVDEVISLVNENEEILGMMRGNLTRMFVAAMAEIVMRSDSRYCVQWHFSNCLYFFTNLLFCQNPS